MAKYTIQVSTIVTAEKEDGTLAARPEHKLCLEVTGLDNKDVSQMQASLIDVQAKWNAAGIEGSDEAPTIPMPEALPVAPVATK